VSGTRATTGPTVFDHAAETYDEIGPPVFATSGKQLTAAVLPQPGERVLDIATGRGAALIPASEAIGPHGLALGVDLSIQMVRHLRATETGTPVAVARMNAMRLGLRSESFDVVMAAHCLLFFDDMFAVLSEAHRVLRTGGRLAVSGWGPPDERWSWLERVGLRRAGDGRRGNMARTAMDTEWLEMMLADTGFTVTDVRWHETELHYADEDEWWAAEWSHGARELLEGLGPGQIERIRAEAMPHAAGLRDQHGIPYLYRSFVIIGTAGATSPAGPVLLIPRGRRTRPAGAVPKADGCPATPR
jgi:ubiquinone/menaquinone biosynthesis C-methylase UbiE